MSVTRARQKPLTPNERKIRLLRKGFVTLNHIEHELDEINVSRITPVEGEVEVIKTTYRNVMHSNSFPRKKWPLKEGYKYVPTIVKKEESV